MKGAEPAEMLDVAYSKRGPLGQGGGMKAPKNAGQATTVSKNPPGRPGESPPDRRLSRRIVSRAPGFG